MATLGDPTEVSFRYDDPTRRFVAELDGVEVAFSEADLIGAQTVLIKHTEVSPLYEGRGYGSALVRHMLDQARAQGKTVIPICPFSAKYVRDHAEYLDVVRPDYRPAMR